jgi:hypothetical protein
VNTVDSGRKHLFIMNVNNELPIVCILDKKFGSCLSGPVVLSLVVVVVCVGISLFSGFLL